MASAGLVGLAVGCVVVGSISCGVSVDWSAMGAASAANGSEGAAKRPDSGSGVTSKGWESGTSPARDWLAGLQS